MKKLLVLFIAMLMLVSCGNQSSGTVHSSSEESTVSETSSENSSSEQSTVSVYTEEEESGHLCSDEDEWDYVFKYGNIPGELIDYIGQDRFNAWVYDESYTKERNIQTCIEYFGLTKEDLTEALDPPETDDTGFDLTVSEIDALCSGDQAKINRAFASEYAAVSESGSIYTISWLAAHTAEDYEAAGLSESAVETALANCAELDIPAVNEYVAKARAALNQSSSSEVSVGLYTEDVDLEAIGGDSIDWDYGYRYYDIPSELIKYIGNDDFQQWAAKDYKAVNIQTVIERYHLTADDLIDVLSPSETPDPDGLCLSVSDIETLFSGDQAEINRAFASEYAAVSESGSIYTVFWLASHTAEDYEAAGLSESAVETALANCAELDIPAVNEYVAEAEAMLNE